MISGLVTVFLITLAGASAATGLAALMRERGLRPVRRLAAIFGGQTKVGRVLLGAAFASAWIVAGAKPGGVRSGDGRDVHDAQDGENARGAAQGYCAVNWIMVLFAGKGHQTTEGAMVNKKGRGQV